MKPDISRRTFARQKHYSSVVAQQGRVLLDADVNELSDIERYLAETEGVDVIGPCGIPKTDSPLVDNPSFRVRVLNDTSLTIGPGRYYVSGVLCENEAEVAIELQPDLPVAAGSPKVLQQLTGNQPATALGLVYLDVWRRLITALDDDRIRETALGGPDTTCRVKTVWQVKVLPLPSANPATAKCGDSFSELASLTAGTGMMDARLQPAGSQPDPCQPTPTSGLQRLENQLYRVEVHEGGARGAATIKWSRDNGSVVTAIRSVSGSTLTVADLGRDETLSFANDDWVEISDDVMDLGTGRGSLVQIQIVHPETNEIVLKTAPSPVDTNRNARLRRWDMPRTDSVPDGVKMNASGTDWLTLDPGIQVQFSDGTFKTGDYWLIPARGALGTIEWPLYVEPGTTSTMQPPEGVRHDYCPLALVKVESGKLVVAEDCRTQFPPLTDIDATDVGFDDGSCELGGVDTVQEAIDRLCKARDLRFHNRHLHGWGAVCGLQVHCADDQHPRKHVTVLKGYAIDCDGNDLILEADTPLDIVQKIADANTADPNLKLPTTDGEVMLAAELDAAKQIEFVLHKFDPSQDGLQGLLNGTLIQDMYRDCVQPVLDFFKKETTPQPGEAAELVGLTAKRIIALINLLIQIPNPANGKYVFLSKEEHDILHTLYDDLKKLLQSHTYCAMFDKARPFPEYPAANLAGATTHFGKDLQPRLRAVPGGLRAVTLGNGNTISLYDLREDALIAVLEFPAPDAVVQDVAFSSDGKTMYAVARSSSTSGDSLFATGAISGTTAKWSAPGVICGLRFVTLASHPTKEGVLYAVALGEGLYRLDSAHPEAKPIQIFPFNACGHLQIAVQGINVFAYVTSGKAGAGSTVYSSVLRIPLRAGSALSLTDVLTLNLPATGFDDMIAFGMSERTLLAVVAKSGGATLKSLLLYDVTRTMSGQPGVVSELENSLIRLAFDPVTQFLALTFSESYQVKLVNVDKHALETECRFPVQITPCSVAFVLGGKAEELRPRMAVLDGMSKTLTSFDATVLRPGHASGRPEDNDALSTYRTSIFEAYADLLGGLLQYAKDCFCDHLLVNCPADCDPDVDRLKLACISIRGGEVYKVCNFARRNVVTFPKLGYWLSVVPIIPMIREAVQAFCCAALPDFFGKYHVVTPVASYNRVSSATMVQGYRYSEILNRSTAMGLWTDRVVNYRKIFSAWIAADDPTPDIQPAVRTKVDVVHRPVDEATNAVAAAGAQVEEVRPLDKTIELASALKASVDPAQIPAGAKVRLYEQDGVVRYYEVTEAPPPAVADLTARVDAQQTAIAGIGTLQATVSQLSDQLTLKDQAITGIQAQLTDQMAQKETEIGALQTSVTQQLAQKDQAIAGVQTQIADEISKKETEIGALQTSVTQQLAQKEQAISTLQTKFTDQVAQKETEIAALQAHLADQLAQKDQAIAGLQTQMTQQLTQKDQQIAGLQTQLTNQLAQRDQQIAALATQFQKLQTDHAALATTVSNAKIDELRTTVTTLSTQVIRPTKPG